MTTKLLALLLYLTVNMPASLVAADWNYNNTAKVTSGPITITDANGTPMTVTANAGGINPYTTVPIIINDGGSTYTFDQGVKLSNGYVYLHESELDVWTQYSQAEFNAKFTYSETPIYKMEKYGTFASSTISASANMICANAIYKAAHPTFTCSMNYTYDSPGGPATPHSVINHDNYKRAAFNVNLGLPSYVINGVTFYLAYEFSTLSGTSRDSWNCYATGIMYVDLQFEGVWPKTTYSSGFASGQSLQSPLNVSCSNEVYMTYNPSTTITRNFDAWVHYVKINTKEVWIGGELFANKYAGTLSDGNVTSITNPSNLQRLNNANYVYYANETGDIYEIHLNTNTVHSFDVPTMSTTQIIVLPSGIEMSAFISNVVLN
jgi:hypothetical protein